MDTPRTPESTEDPLVRPRTEAQYVQGGEACRDGERHALGHEIELGGSEKDPIKDLQIPPESR